MKEMNFALMENIQNYLNTFASYVFMSFGLIGNLMVFIVLMSNSEMRSQPSNVYLATLTIPDTILVIIYLFQAIPSLVPLTPDFCKLTMDLVITAYSLSSLFNAVVSIDRLLSVYFPKKFVFKNKASFQLKFIFVTFILYFIACSTNYFLFTQIKVNIGNLTLSHCGYNDRWYGFINDIYLFTLSHAISIIVMITSALLIAYKLIKISKSLQRDLDLKSKKFIRIILILNIYYIVTQLPICIVTMLRHFSVALKMDRNLTIFLYDITNFLSVIHNAFSFYVYFCINKLFRKRLLNIFKSLFFIRNFEN